jgi:transposase
VIRPRRPEQYRSGKSDPIDAQAAPRAVLAGTATARPKGTETARSRCVPRPPGCASLSGEKARTPQAANQL